MEKFIPYQKLSKKQRKQRDLQQRHSWEELRPVTRTTPSKKLYHRKHQPNLPEEEDR